MSNHRTSDATGGDESTDAADRGDESTDPPGDPIVSTGKEPLEALTDVTFVGPVTAATLADADVGAEDVLSRRISYNQLVDCGVNPGVAAKIRREHSLSWSFESSGDDLDRRSAQVRGLDDDEREWVAASAGDWETDAESWTTDAAADGSGDPEDAEAAWRSRSAPEPVSDVDGVDDDVTRRLARGGITSVRALATVNVESAADALDIDADALSRLRSRARSLTD